MAAEFPIHKAYILKEFQNENYIFTVVYENSAHFLRFGEQGISYLDGYVVVPLVPYDYLQNSKASLFF